MNDRFREQPVVQPVPASKNYVLCQDYRIEMLICGQPVSFLIPHGFTWDGMSIPRPFWVSTGCPFAPKHLLPGLVHDYLYRAGRTSREFADRVMHQLCEENGVGRYNRCKMYWAVRLFGVTYWRFARKRSLSLYSLFK